MASETITVYEFSSGWNILRDLQEKLKQQLQGELSKIAEPVIMASSELVENAIKYGESNFNFQLSTNSEYVIIRVHNVLGRRGDLALLKNRIEKIKESKNLLGLYTERLRELIDDPNDSTTRLGLIRIAYEGKFELELEVEDEEVRILAKRRRDLAA